MTPTQEAVPATPADRVAAKMFALYCSLPRDEQAVFANLMRQVAATHSDVAGYETVYRDSEEGGEARAPLVGKVLCLIDDTPAGA